MTAVAPTFHRVIPVEQTVRNDMAVEPFESAAAIIDHANAWGVTDCICRVQKKLIGDPCDHPVDVCMIFNQRPGAFDGNPVITALTREDAHATLKRAADAGLVHSVSNSQDGQFLYLQLLHLLLRHLCAASPIWASPTSSPVPPSSTWSTRSHAPAARSASITASSTPSPYAPKTSTSKSTPPLRRMRRLRPPLPRIRPHPRPSPRRTKSCPSPPPTRTGWPDRAQARDLDLTDIL